MREMLMLSHSMLWSSSFSSCASSSSNNNASTSPFVRSRFGTASSTLACRCSFATKTTKSNKKSPAPHPPRSHRLRPRRSPSRPPRRLWRNRYAFVPPNTEPPPLDTPLEEIEDDPPPSPQSPPSDTEEEEDSSPYYLPPEYHHQSYANSQTQQQQIQQQSQRIAQHQQRVKPAQASLPLPPFILSPQLHLHSDHFNSNYPNNPNDSTTNRIIMDHVLLPISATHIAQTIDLDSTLNEILSELPVRQQRHYKHSILVELEPEQKVLPPAGTKQTTQQAQAQAQAQALELELALELALEDVQYYPRYIAVFYIGSVVGVNVAPALLESLQHVIKETVAVDPTEDEFERNEQYSIMKMLPRTTTTTTTTTHPHDPAAAPPLNYRTMSPASRRRVTGEYCVMDELDMDGVSVITHVLAQTVALDSYGDMVDELMGDFGDINQMISLYGYMPRKERYTLFGLIADNHIIFNDMISKLRIKDRSDTAWQKSRYETIWYGMRSEYEMDDRFHRMITKVNLIQQNARFFVEVMDSQRTNNVEWIIALLIASECILVIFDLTGMTEVIIQPHLDALSQESSQEYEANASLLLREIASTATAEDLAAILDHGDTPSGTSSSSTSTSSATPTSSTPTTTSPLPQHQRPPNTIPGTLKEVLNKLPPRFSHRRPPNS